MTRAPTPAPVVLFAYDRPDRLARTLDLLRGERIELLYAFIDGPQAGPSDAQDAVADVVAAVDWTDVECVQRPSNLGLSASIRAGLDDVLSRHDRAVVIEDDIWVAPGFYEFVCRCLDRYAEDERVAAATGLRYPFVESAFDGYPADVFFSPRFSSWGWGTWARFWQTVEFDRAALASRVGRASITLDGAGQDVATMARQYLDGTLHGAWDVACAINLLLDRRLVACPRWNLVVNGGLHDGVHGGRKAPPLAWEEPPERFPAELRFPSCVAPEHRIVSTFLSLFGAPPRAPLRRRAASALTRAARGRSA